jgi:hypothetical protein
MTPTAANHTAACGATTCVTGRGCKENTKKSKGTLANDPNSTATEAEE